VAKSNSSANPALQAEPRGIGSAGARDPLAREVKLLGALLGQVIVEQEGPDALELVERVRKATIALASAGWRQRERTGSDSADTLDSVDTRQAAILIRAFSLYFQLTNLAEEKQRIGACASGSVPILGERPTNRSPRPVARWLAKP
jgi:phosphoenolpyruvate carboxylase